MSASLLISEIKKIIKDSEIMKEDDTKWPTKNKDGRQELEIRLGNDHISFEVDHVHIVSILTIVADNTADGQDRLARRRD